MINPEFYKAYYDCRATRTSKAAMVVLVNGWSIGSAARYYGINKSAVSKLVNEIRKQGAAA